MIGAAACDPQPPPSFEGSIPPRSSGPTGPSRRKRWMRPTPPSGGLRRPREPDLVAEHLRAAPEAAFGPALPRRGTGHHRRGGARAPVRPDLVPRPRRSRDAGGPTGVHRARGAEPIAPTLTVCAPARRGLGGNRPPGRLRRGLAQRDRRAGGSAPHWWPSSGRRRGGTIRRGTGRRLDLADRARPSEVHHKGTQPRRGIDRTAPATSSVRADPLSCACAARCDARRWRRD